MKPDQPYYGRLRKGRKDPSVNWYPDPDAPGFERAVVFEPGFGRNPEEGSLPSSERYGRSAMSIRFLLRGDAGVVQFLMGTGWVPEKEEIGGWGYSDWVAHRPFSRDVGYHARTAHYEGQESMGQCEYLGAECFYDGSGLLAEEVMADFFDRGERAVWERLHRYYDRTFGLV